jgi:hypothetical protein
MVLVLLVMLYDFLMHDFCVVLAVFHCHYLDISWSWC